MGAGHLPADLHETPREGLWAGCHCAIWGSSQLATKGVAHRAAHVISTLLVSVPENLIRTAEVISWFLKVGFCGKLDCVDLAPQLGHSGDCVALGDFTHLRLIFLAFKVSLILLIKPEAMSLDCHVTNSGG